MSSHGLQRTRQAVDRLSNRLWVRLTLSIALICLVAWLALLLVLKDALGYVTERILVGKKRQDSQGLQEPLRRPHISATPSKEEASENRAMNVLYPLQRNETHDLDYSPNESVPKVKTIQLHHLNGTTQYPASFTTSKNVFPYEGAPTDASSTHSDVFSMAFSDQATRESTNKNTVQNHNVDKAEDVPLGSGRSRIPVRSKVPQAMPLQEAISFPENPPAVREDTTLPSFLVRGHSKSSDGTGQSRSQKVTENQSQRTARPLTLSMPSNYTSPLSRRTSVELQVSNKRRSLDLESLLSSSPSSVRSSDTPLLTPGSPASPMVSSKLARAMSYNPSHARTLSYGQSGGYSTKLPVRGGPHKRFRSSDASADTIAAHFLPEKVASGAVDGT